MPLIKAGGPLPSWSELSRYQILRGDAGTSHSIAAQPMKSKVVVVSGEVRPVGHDAVSRGDSFDIAEDDEVTFEFQTAATLVLFEGTWGEATGKAGVFDPEVISRPVEGDPVGYEKTTLFDNHYHDCDEFWVIVDGRGTAVSEGIHHELEPGDCLATRMGDHHDFPLVNEPVTAVFFETTLRGRKRLGHLWVHRHGAARRDPGE